ncbi:MULTISPECIES: iron-siderophore ABC transporter substrate-binding protein [unclassified Leptolyngbya]|uniref:ABC transporter substrate-binding protein n=1 Tax=unclassified Leptolyngbya TaxID=2650499 RepID=UPI001682F7CB|nr:MULTISPECIES: iron-siderophore ABC transporter substrate-binding protein [unclassified Leptolyngbya]MBD1908990.1 iron-siderophore ABC transporter substrate-binding protein [Leptolyngbya sp. FACHB-8]MBD2153017.1 iron-siderophore ABC transporter substrate-binding protein [Leptolyngbya sp. FACHB-16]
MALSSMMQPWNQPLILKRVLLFLLTLVLAVACGSPASSPGASDRTTDANCRTVQHTLGETCVPLNPQRIVVLWTPTLANVLALEVQPIGVASYPAESGITIPPYLEERLGDVAFVGDQNQPSLEKILQLQPDLILGTINEAIYPQLSQIAPTVILAWEGTPSWKQHLFDVAAVLNKTAEAEQIMARYNQRVAELKASLGDRPATLEVSFVHLCCNQVDLDLKNSFIGTILEDVGFRRPPAQDKTAEGGMVKLSEERLADADGDLLFVTTFSNDDDRALQKLQQQPLWSQLKAVQRNQVYPVDYSTWRGADILAAEQVLDDLSNYLVPSSSAP